MSIRLKVEGGRLVAAAPEGWPEGAELDVVLADQDDDMSDEEVAELDSALEKSLEQAATGRFTEASEFLAKLTARRTS
ncbi:MAG: hypothetical protein HY791_13700 [Deltaproteobacteria bacterium]|nr:hypothetical protein [Deltaproteobacteria bacterium]